MRHVLEARYELAEAQRDLEFKIEANLMVQRGELTISEAEGVYFHFRPHFHERNLYPAWKMIDDALDHWLVSLTEEGRKRQHREFEQWLAGEDETSRQKHQRERWEQVKQLWEDKFQVREGWASRIMYGWARVRPGNWWSQDAIEAQRRLSSGAHWQSVAPDLRLWELVFLGSSP